MRPRLSLVRRAAARGLLAAGVACAVAWAGPAAAASKRGTSPAGSDDPYAGLHPYVGDIHVHTGLAIYRVLAPDDPHAIGTPDEVIDAAESRGLDFLAITDHSNNINDPRGREWRRKTGHLYTMPDGTRTASEWDYIQALIAKRNQPGRFVVFLGIEYTRGTTPTASPGHQLGIFPEDKLPRYCSNFLHNAGDCPTAADFFKFVKEENGVAVQAHPCAKWGPTDWSAYDPVVNGVEILAGKCEFAPNGYNYALGTLGYHLGARGSSDSHHFEVGSNDKTICFAPELTRKAILDAMRANMCYYADQFPVTLKFDINGSPMGSTVTDRGEGIRIRATAHTDWQTEFDHMEVIHDGKVFVRVDCEDSEYDDCALSTYVPSDTSGYYYVGISNAYDRRLAVSSPIWVTGRN